MATLKETLKSTGKEYNLARTRARMSMDMLAKASNYEKASISRLETGKLSPTVETLFRLAEAMGYRLDIKLRKVTGNKDDYTNEEETSVE